MINKFYLKVAFCNKIKKYAFQNVDQIKFTQIKQSLGLKDTWKDSLYYYELIENFSLTQNFPKQHLTEEAVLEHLSKSQIVPLSTIKLRIIEKTLMSQQQKKRKQSSCSIDIPQIFQKKRSRSMQLQASIFDFTCKTEALDMTTKQLNFSQIESDKVKYEVKNFQNQIIKENQNKDKSVLITINNSILRKDNISYSMCQNFTKYQQINLKVNQSFKIIQNQKIQLEKLREKIKAKQKRKQIEKQQKKKQINQIYQFFGLL